jgi:dolichyl-diphosphooligosaccharide--protein glycosyltransferase
MSNRTVLVDNNTWNNTHIATVGLTLASEEEKGYEIAKSLDADYILVMFGGTIGVSDDASKFLWFVRIAQHAFPGEIEEYDYYKDGMFGTGEHNGAGAFLNSTCYKMMFNRWNELD